MSNSIKIGPKIESLAKVNISLNNIEVGQSMGLYPGDAPVSLEDLILKPLSHFHFKSDLNCYVLNINVLAGSHHAPDQRNAIECKTIGKNILVFINYAIEDEGQKEKDSDHYQNFRYQIEFSDDYTDFIKGKEIIIATASGDPEEGSVSKVIIEDEDEI